MRIFCLFSLCLIIFNKPLFASQNKNVVVFAEQNMALPIVKISRLYSQKTGVIVSASFNFSEELVKNIDFGEQVDVFISGQRDQIELLKLKGLVDVYNIGYIAYDRMVLISDESNKEFPQKLIGKNFSKALKFLNQNNAELIIDNNINTAGLIEKDFIQEIENNPDFSQIKIFRKIDEDRSSILESLKENKGKYVITLASKISNKNGYKILSRSDKSIFYQALVIAGNNMENSREFLSFLKSPQARLVFKESGFITD